MLNLSALKNVITGLTPAMPAASSSPASTPDAIAAKVALKQKELSQGKTEAQVERLRVELRAAERAFTEAETAEGECLVDGRAATAAMEARRTADDRVRAVKAALSVAITKNQAALVDLLHATRQASIEADDAAVAAFKTSVLELESVLCGEMKRAADKVGATLTAVKDRSGGDGGVASSLKDFILWFPVYLDRACAALIPSGRTYSQVLDEKKKPFSAWADDVKYSMSRRRKG